MQSNISLQGTTTSKPYTIFPASPKLLESLNISSPLFLSKRKEILELKQKEYPDDKLRPYQKMALNFILNSGLTGIGIFDEQRLGKTPTILTALKYKKAKALIIVPKSLIYPWYYEYKKWYNDEVTVIDGSLQQRKKQYETKDSLILSYNTASRDEDLIEKNYQFRAAIVSITQREIETHIKPVLIIVANKKSSYYWGRNEDATWMGYDMERISDVMELYQIKGFKDKPDRLNPDLKQSSLRGSLILFYGMYDERNKEKLLSESDFKQLFEKAKVMKKEFGAL